MITNKDGSAIDGQDIIRRVMWRTVPLLTFFYMAAVIDRANVSFAKLQMVKALHMTEATYGLASSLFFIGYVVFEVPSAYAATRFGARFWFARIIGSWGLLTVIIAFTFSGSVFTALRFLLGAAEAGAYPGIIYCLTLWYPQKQRLKMLGIITWGSAFGNAFGSMAGGALLDLNGALGLGGWQWVFLVTGGMAVTVAILMFLFFPNTPQQAKFLNANEKTWLIETVRSSTPDAVSHGNPFRVMLDWRVAFLCLVYMIMNVSLQGVIYWTPTVIKAFGVTGTQNGFLTALPWFLDAIILVVIPPLLQSRKALLVAITLISLIGLLSFAASTQLNINWMRYLALVIGTPCIALLFPCFWWFPSKTFTGTHGAIAFSTISSVANLGGFFAQNLMPWASGLAGKPSGAMAVPAVCLGALGLGAALLMLTKEPKSTLPNQLEA